MGCVPRTGASVPKGVNGAPLSPRSQGVIKNFSESKWLTADRGGTLISDTAFGAP